MLKLRRGIVTSADPLTVRVGSERRPAWADEGMVGEVREGDEVIVNVDARDLGLGSGPLDRLRRACIASALAAGDALPSAAVVEGVR